MKYYRRYVEEEKIEEINKKEYREQLGIYYKNPNVFNDEYYHADRQIRTPFAFYWVEI